ncbi:HAD family hydrolase [Streptomyces sp. NPDC058084]|uniref:HAD family hydrolase n=1 Tax=Streptomyces sp. NPDC058084 TaxID=3346333 RepID=UPI0036F07E27
MRYPPTSTALSTRLSPVATHPVSDTPLGSPSASRALWPSAVILDLFGTLVVAPSTSERNTATTRFASVMCVSPAVAESALTGSWSARHDGQLRSTAEVAAHLVARCDAPVSNVTALELLLKELARDRLRADAPLLQILEELRLRGLRLAVVSDASPDIAEAWSLCDLASYFDATVFSCQLGAVKPAPQLFGTALESLGIAPEKALYVGDGGGDELAGAERAGMRAVRVDRRGGPHGLAFGETSWTGSSIARVEALPSLLSMWRER